MVGATIGTSRTTVSIIEILRYIRSAFADAAVLDSLPLDAAGNPGAWHAWRAHRRQPKQRSSSSSLERSADARTEDGRDDVGMSDSLRQSRNTSIGVANQPGDWNWEGVWEKRVRRGIEASQSEAVLYGNAKGGDELVRPCGCMLEEATNLKWQIRFLDVDDELVETLKKDMNVIVRETGA